MGRLFHILVMVVCVGVVGAAFMFTVDELGVRFLGFKWPLHCLLDRLFGVKCAFCGMTRAFASMADGDIRRAMGYHRVGPVLFLFVVFQIPYRIYVTIVRPKRLHKWPVRFHALFAALVLTAILVNWLIYLGERLL